MDDTTIKVRWATSTRMPADKAEEHEDWWQMVRAYPEAPGHMALQVRTRSPLSGRGKTAYIIAHASLNMDAALSLQAALCEWIDEQRSRMGG